MRLSILKLSIRLINLQRLKLTPCSVSWGDLIAENNVHSPLNQIVP